MLSDNLQMGYYNGMFDGKLARNVHSDVVRKKRQRVDQPRK